MLKLFLMANRNDTYWYCTATDENDAKVVSYLFGKVTKPENARVVSECTNEMLARLRPTQERPTLQKLLDGKHGRIVFSLTRGSSLTWDEANLKVFPSRDRIQVKVISAIGYKDHRWARSTRVITMLNKHLYDRQKMRSAVRKQANDSRIEFIHIFE